MPGVVFLIVVPTANFEQEILNGLFTPRAFSPLELVLSSASFKL